MAKDAAEEFVEKVLGCAKLCRELDAEIDGARDRAAATVEFARKRGYVFTKERLDQYMEEMGARWEKEADEFQREIEGDMAVAAEEAELAAPEDAPQSTLGWAGLGVASMSMVVIVFGAVILIAERTIRGPGLWVIGFGVVGLMLAIGMGGAKSSRQYVIALALSDWRLRTAVGVLCLLFSVAGAVLLPALAYYFACHGPEDWPPYERVFGAVGCTILAVFVVYLAWTWLGFALGKEAAIERVKEMAKLE